MTSAAARGLVACSQCALLARPVRAQAPGFCPRCGEKLAFRRRDAIQRTWALLVAAAVLYVPANVLPVLTTTTVVSSSSDTIMSGVILLYETGSWPLALIVFIASIVIPIGKIAALGYVLVTVQKSAPTLASLAAPRGGAAVPRGGPSEPRGKATGDRERTRLYRIVEFIGRWSMLDVFVDTFVVALVQLSPLMSVEPGPGVVYFMAVVVLTMFAAQSFDPRLIWDRTAPSDLQDPRGR
jgi:paraquat-inducible protein A